MVIIRECDELENRKHLSSEERRILWEKCMQEMRDALGVEELERVMNKINSEVLTSDSDSDPNSSGFVELIMETNQLLKGEALGFKQSLIKDMEIATLQSLWNISSIGNEDDVISEPCESGENVCMIRP